MIARLILALVLVLVLTAPSPASDSSAEQVVSLGDPDAPVDLIFRMPYAVLEVVGTNRKDVWIEARPSAGASPVLPLLPVLSRGNRVEIVALGNARVLEVLIKVPRRSDLTLESSNGGPVRVSGVDGAVEIVNSNAGVFVARLSGSLSVATSNGPIRAVLTGLDHNGLVSLVTSNGPIEVALPASFQGRVLAETDGEPIECDLPVTPEEPAGLRRPGTILSGRIGAGGHLLRLRTENAGISIIRSGEAGVE